MRVHSIHQAVILEEQVEKELPVSDNRLDVEANPSTSDLDVDEIQPFKKKNVDEIHKVEEVEHPLILSGDRDPFYLFGLFVGKMDYK